MTREQKMSIIMLVDEKSKKECNLRKWFILRNTMIKYTLELSNQKEIRNEINKHNSKRLRLGLTRRAKLFVTIGG